MAMKGIEPFGFTTETIAFQHGCMDLSCRTLEVAYQNVGRKKYGVDPRGKEGVDSVLFNDATYTAVKQNIARED